MTTGDESRPPATLRWKCSASLPSTRGAGQGQAWGAGLAASFYSLTMAPKYNKSWFVMLWKPNMIWVFAYIQGNNGLISSSRFFFYTYFCFYKCYISMIIYRLKLKLEQIFTFNLTPSRPDPSQPVHLHNPLAQLISSYLSSNMTDFFQTCNLSLWESKVTFQVITPPPLAKTKF